MLIYLYFTKNDWITGNVQAPWTGCEHVKEEGAMVSTGCRSGIANWLCMPASDKFNIIKRGQYTENLSSLLPLLPKAK
jgi:hypothetical protein